MPKRSVSWDETLSEKLKDMKFAKGFILALLDERMSLQEALGRTIRSYGIKEFCSLANLEIATVQRAINVNHNPTKETLEGLLEPFGLALGAKEKDQAA